MNKVLQVYHQLDGFETLFLRMVEEGQMHDSIDVEEPQTFYQGFVEGVGQARKLLEEALKDTDEHRVVNIDIAEQRIAGGTETGRISGRTDLVAFSHYLRRNNLTLAEAKNMIEGGEPPQSNNKEMTPEEEQANDEQIIKDNQAEHKRSIPPPEVEV